MQDHHHSDLPTSSLEDGHERAADGELGVLRQVFKLLPGGVTVQDERGRFLLVNDAAAGQFGITPHAPMDSSELERRRETCLELLRANRTAVAEESVGHEQHKQVLLTSHRPVRIADRRLLLSTSADITELKAVEDQLFRSAYYDELTDLPTRRVIEHRVKKVLERDDASAHFALAFLDIDISSTSTTITATGPATHCWSRFPSGSRSICAIPTCFRGSAATNSCCC
jgi:c-di-GMP phosphodiesterase Gmr